MPRLKNESSVLLADVQRRIEAIVEAARQEGRADALGQIRSLVGGPAAAVKRGPGRPPKAASAAAPKKRRKNSWSGLTAEQRLARVNAIRKGKGLAPRES